MSGDRLAVLFDAHEERLYRLARRLSSSADEASDLVQETFLRAARSVTSIPAGAVDEEAWLVRVLVNIRRDEWRKRRVRAESAALVTGGASTSARSVEAAVIAKRAVWDALDALRPRRRAIIVMYELEGMTVQSIASTLGVTAITVRWHLSLARRELKRLLAPFMGDTR